MHWTLVSSLYHLVFSSLIFVITKTTLKISWKTLLIALLCLRKTQNNILQMLKKSKGHQLQLLGQTSLSNSEGRLDFFKCTLLKWKKVNRTGSRNKNSSWGWQGWQLQATKLSHPSPGFVKFPTGSSGGVHMQTCSCYKWSFHRFTV